MATLGQVLPLYVGPVQSAVCMYMERMARKAGERLQERFGRNGRGMENENRRCSEMETVSRESSLASKGKIYKRK